MHTVTCFDGSAVGEAELASIMAEYLELEGVRGFRRLLVRRCGLLAAATAIVGLGLHWLTAAASWFSISALLAPPASAWILEMCRDARLGRLLSDVPGRVTQVVTNGPQHQKVVKSS
jgi:Flp pilus assembly protein TadB